MPSDHNVMFLVLCHLAQCGSVKSGEVAEALPFLSREYASLVLTRCYRRRFVSRQPYKHGRVRGFFYELTNKGAEWVYYKSSQWKRAEERACETTRKVEGENRPPPREMTVELTQKERMPERKDFFSSEVSLPWFFINELLDRNQSLEQRCESLEESYDLIALTVMKRRRESDLACYQCWHGWQEKLRNLEKKPCRERHAHEYSYKDYYWMGWSNGFGLGLQHGRLIGQLGELMRIQGTLIRALFKRKLKNPFGYTHMPDFYPQRRKAGVDIRIGLEEPVKDSLTKETVEPENNTEAHDWTDFNDWWLHLPSAYVKYGSLRVQLIHSQLLGKLVPFPGSFERVYA